MLMRSISVGSAPATDHATALAVISLYRSARSSAGTAFESARPAMCRSGCSTTAAATTGPARHPRPTSSVPATYTKPTRRSQFSSVLVAATRPPMSSVLTSSFLLLTFRLLRVFHARGLALQIAQVIQLGAPDLRRPHHLDLGDGRRMQRENALHALAERHLAHRERGARAAAVHADHDALEDLNPFLVAFADLHVHADRVARLHRRPLGQLRFFHQFKCAHVSPPATPLVCAVLRRRATPSPANPAGESVSSPAIPASATGGFPRGFPTAAPRARDRFPLRPGGCSAESRAAPG